MDEHPEVRIVFIANTAFWLLLVAVFYLRALRGGPGRAWWDQLLAQRRPALVIAGATWLAFTIGGFPDPGRALGGLLVAGQVFGAALIGLALAREEPGVEALPVAQAIKTGQRPWRAVALLLLIAVLVQVPVLIAGAIGSAIGSGIFHEVRPVSEGVSNMPDNIWQPFLLLLGGAGFAEETPYRLLLVPLCWRLLQRRRWLAIIVSGVAFGAYHLTPLDTIYYQFLAYPATQFFSSALIGMVWAWLFTRRGYETAVLAHTFSDWLPLALFTLIAAFSG